MITTTLKRDSYGILHAVDSSTNSDRDLLFKAYSHAQQASINDLIPHPYDNISRDRKGRFDGRAIHHDIYDVSQDGKTALVCVRMADGSKYGVKTTSKDYYLIWTQDDKTIAEPMNKSICSKLAKASGNNIGMAIEVLFGVA